MARLQTAFGLDGSKHRIEQALDLGIRHGSGCHSEGQPQHHRFARGGLLHQYERMRRSRHRRKRRYADRHLRSAGSHRGYCAWDAARLGAFLHGLAAENCFCPMARAAFSRMILPTSFHRRSNAFFPPPDLNAGTNRPERLKRAQPNFRILRDASEISPSGKSSSEAP